MRYALLIALALVGCSSAPVKFSDGLGAAYLAVDAVAKTAIDLCGATQPVSQGGQCADGAILTTTTMRGLHVSVGEALDLLDAARLAYQVGAVSKAEDKLAAAQALVVRIQGYLLLAQERPDE